MIRTRILALLALMAALPAHAQQPAPPQGNEPPTTPAEQVVGLFGATCMTYGANVSALRAFLNDQHAPQMPQAARDAFLTGRPGQVFDVSFKDIKLALVSLDAGGCEAVAEHADGNQVRTLLQQQAAENHATLTPTGTQGRPNRPGVQLSAYDVSIANQTMHILVATAQAAPQAVLTLVPPR